GLVRCLLFSLTHTATPVMYALSLHDALPILVERVEIVEGPLSVVYGSDALAGVINIITRKGGRKENTLGVRVRIQEESAGTAYRSEEHTSELQSRENLVCRLLLEKKKKNRGG